MLACFGDPSWDCLFTGNLFELELFFVSNLSLSLSEKFLGKFKAIALQT